MTGEVRLSLEDYDKLREDNRKAARQKRRTTELLSALDSFLNTVKDIEAVREEIVLFNQNQREVRFTVKDGRLTVQLLTDDSE